MYGVASTATFGLCTWKCRLEHRCVVTDAVERLYFARPLQIAAIPYHVACRHVTTLQGGRQENGRNGSQHDQVREQSTLISSPL